MNDMHPHEEHRPDFSAMEAALRDACTRARHAIFPLSVMLKLYRSVTALARSLMRARADAGLPRGLGDDLIALLDATRDAACAHFPDPEMPVMDAIVIHRAVIALAAAAHRARAGRQSAAVETPESKSLPPPLRGRAGETGDRPTEIAVSTPLPDPTPQRGRESDLASPPPTDLPDPDGPHCAWRNDHKADRDQKAHERLRTVIDERVFAKIRAANQREREERGTEAA
jgi:hypothetical protein